MASATKAAGRKPEAEFQAGTAWYGSAKKTAHGAPPRDTPPGRRTATG